METQRATVLKVVKGIAIFIVSALVLFVGAIIIGKELQWKPAIEIVQWLNANYGITLSAGVLGALVIVAKYIFSFTKASNKSQLMLSNTENKLTAVESNLAILESMVAAMPNNSQTIQNATVQTNEQMAILYEVLKLFMEKNTNDTQIKQLFTAFEQTKLFDKARELGAVKIETPTAKDIIAAGKDILEKVTQSEIVKSTKGVRLL